MAPVHCVNSYVLSASSSEVRTNTSYNRESTDYRERNLPISYRGRFFEDSFFENARTRYEKKIKKILGEWEENDSLFGDWDDAATCLSHKQLYRYIPERNQETQIISATSENDCLEILLDVREFTATDLKVRVIGETEIEVEGQRKQKENEITNDHKRQNQFHYLISLPEEADMDTITSAMSADGILSICVHIKKLFSNTFHQEPVEVNEDRTTSLSSGSASAVSFSENFSDAFSQSSSKTSLSTMCVNLLNKEKAASEKSGERTDMKINGHQASCHLKDIQSALETVSCFEELLNRDNQEICDGSCGFQNRSNRCKDTGEQALLDEMNIEDTKDDTAAFEEKELEENLTSESSCIVVSLDNFPVTRRESVSYDPFFENVKKTCHISGNENLINSEGNSKEENASKICHVNETSVMGKEMKALTANKIHLKSENQQKQPNEFVVPIKMEDMQSAQYDTQRKESVAPQTKQLLNYGADVIGVVNHASLESSVLDNMVSSTKTSELSTQQCLSSNQRLTENAIHKQTNNLRNSTESTGVHQNVDVFQSEDQSSKKFVIMNKTVCANEQEEIAEEELTLQDCDELQALLNSSSKIVEHATPLENITKQDSSDMKLLESKVSLEEFQSVKADSSPEYSNVICDTFRPNVSRNLSITKMGSIFTDPYFGGLQDYHLTVIREVLAKYTNLSTTYDEMSCYRNLTIHDEEENMAIITLEDKDKIYFILDVYDIIKKGEVIVNIVNEREILVKEQVNVGKSDAELTNLFSKRLNIDGEVDTDSSEAAISSEGVLVISIPKKTDKLEKYNSA